jgi:hypothetical protein
MIAPAVARRQHGIGAAVGQPRHRIGKADGYGPGADALEINAPIRVAK